MNMDMKRYAFPGTDSTFICLPYQKPEGAVETVGDCPGPGHIVDESGTWIRDPKLPYTTFRQQEILAHWPVAQQLEAITEMLQGRSAKFNQLMADIAEIKQTYPKN